jgi:putative ABC transport system permease protein
MINDIRYALRVLRQNPGFALVAILSLALGIGANAVIYSETEAMILRPLPVPDPSRVVSVSAYLPGDTLVGSVVPNELSYPDFRDFQKRATSYDGVIGFQYASFGFAPDAKTQPQSEYGLLVSGNFFQALRVAPELGRPFRPDEDQIAGRDAVAIISHNLWVNQFGERSDIVGRSIRLNGIDFTIVGVAPEKFGVDVFTVPDIFVPLAMSPRLSGTPAVNPLERRDLRMTDVKGRLKPGVTLAQADAEARVIAQQWAQAYPATNRNWTAGVRTERQHRFEQSPPNVLLMGFQMALAVVVLLIACANIANLLLSRARARAREIAVRLAIGAGRARLIRQLLTESLVVAVLGGGLGLALAVGVTGALGSLRVPSDPPVQFSLAVDGQVVVFSLLATAASVLLFGLIPALQATRGDLVPALKASGTDAGRRSRLWGRNSLVTVQVAASTLLLVLATQIYRGSSKYLSSPTGFRTTHVLMAMFDPSLVRSTPEQTDRFYRQLLDRMRRTPGVRSAALARFVPASPSADEARVVPEGFQLPRGAESVSVLSNIVSDGYFDTAGIPILDGRGFRETDDASTPRVAVVNERFAAHYYPGQNAVGKRFRNGGPTGPWVEIVGVAKRSTYLFPGEPPLEVAYFPLSQNSWARMTLMAQSTGPSSTLAEPLRALVHSIDAGEPMFNVQTMEQYFDMRVGKLLGLLSGTFAAMAILGLSLAMVGLYGLMSYAVSRRTREIGIRMAIGAGRVEVLAMVMKQGMLLVAAGSAIGLVLSVGVSKALTAAISLPSFNLVLMLLAPVGLAAVAALGAYLPARRASLVDPIVVLRQD